MNGTHQTTETTKTVERDLLREEVLGILGISDSQLTRYLGGNPTNGLLGLRAVCPEYFYLRQEFFCPKAVKALQIYQQWSKRYKAKTLEELAMKRGYPV